MKRIIIVLALVSAMLAVIVTPAYSQFSYGIRLGGMIPTGWVSGSDCTVTKHSGGFSGGATCEYVTPQGGLAFDASLMYTRLGANLSVPPGIEGVTGSLAKNYLHIPVNVKYKFWLKKYYSLLAPYIFAGPDIMIRLGGKKENSYYSTRTFQAGCNVGIGFDATNVFQIQVGYRFGLTNSLASPGTYHNDGVNISVALLFEI